MVKEWRLVISQHAVSVATDPTFGPPPPRYPYQPWDSSYVVRSINLPDLLTSSSLEKLELRELARMDDKDLPGKDLPSRVGLPGRVGCGVLGSKIVFASGMKPNFDPNRFGPPFGPDFSKDAYAFDIHDHEQGIVKMPGALNGGKYSPVMVEFAGKLYVLSYKWAGVPFEVFDPQQGTWSVLPSYPDAGGCYPLSTASYAIAGTKLFVYQFGFSYRRLLDLLLGLCGPRPRMESPQFVPRRPVTIFRPSSSGGHAAARTL